MVREDTRARIVAATLTTLKERDSPAPAPAPSREPGASDSP